MQNWRGEDLKFIEKPYIQHRIFLLLVIFPTQLNKGCVIQHVLPYLLILPKFEYFPIPLTLQIFVVLWISRSFPHCVLWVPVISTTSSTSVFSRRSWLWIMWVCWDCFAIYLVLGPIWYLFRFNWSDKPTTSCTNGVIF